MQNITVAELMNPGLCVVSSTSTVAEVVQLMYQKRFGAVLIGSLAELEGIFSERDLLNRVISQGLQPAETPITQVMTPHPLRIEAQANLQQALQIMETHQIRHLPVVDENGMGLGMLGMRDVMKATVKHLEQENEALNQLNQLKDEFLANTSHELRTPLNGIIGIAESMLDGATGNLSPKQHYNLALIVSSGRRLANLVNDLLDFSRLRHKNLELNCKPIALGPLIDVLFAILFPLTGNKPIQLHNQIGMDFPAVWADEDRIQQILLNLIGNAIKFTEAGQVEVLAHLEAQQAVIEIRDTGIGIPESKLERIFEAFEQVEGDSSRKYGGTGIGLTISQQLVQLHGGELKVQSRLGQGSCFSLNLPVTEAQPTAPREHLTPIRDPDLGSTWMPAHIISAHPIEATAGQSERHRILIVDDEHINSQVLANLLSLENYAIHQVDNGPAALALLESGQKFDLILLDIMMPKMSGYEVCRRIRENFAATDLPVVLLTAKNQVSDLVEGFHLGANDYLTKPFSRNELRARIKTHLELAKINTAYSRFVPREFLSFLGHDSIVQVKLGDQVLKHMTVLFSDIRSFTSLSELMSPKENFDFLNSYLRRVSPAIRSHGGIIDKYIGDGIMALFPEQAEDALQAGIEMQRIIQAHNFSRLERGYEAIEIGIGLHLGNLMLGTIGNNERMEGTVIADAVNVASRLEGLTKIYGNCLIISEDVRQALPNPTKYPQRYLGQVKIKGKQQRLGIFDVFASDSGTQQALKQATLSSFETGIQAFYAQDFKLAEQHFLEILSQNPDDQVVKTYLEQTQNQLSHSSQTAQMNPLLALEF